MEANVVAAVALSTLLMKILVLDEMPELFHGAHKLGTLTEAVLASLLAGYVFFFFVQQITESKKLSVMAPFVKSQAEWITSIAENQVAELAQAAEVPMELATLTLDQVQSAFGKLSPNSEAPLYVLAAGRRATWIEYFEFNRDRSTQAINTLRYQHNYLTPEISAAVADIDNCKLYWFVRHVTQSLGRTINNDNMGVIADIFYAYALRCRELRGYAEQYAEEFAP